MITSIGYWYFKDGKWICLRYGYDYYTYFTYGVR